MPCSAARQPPSDLYITDELDRRRGPAIDPLTEVRAFQDLAGRMLDRPEEVLPRFVELAMQITNGSSSGLSLFASEPAPGVFRWRYLCGSLSAFEHAETPRDDSPCGVTLDEARPVLSCHPERFYQWISGAGIIVPEVLLVPLHFAGAEPIGTLWVVAEREGHFNGQHARALSDLAHFAGIAVRMARAQEDLKTALSRRDVLAREMVHRVNNLFAVAQSLVHLTARASNSKEEMAKVLAGRFAALARAHALVRQNPDAVIEEQGLDLGVLVRTLVAPYQTEETQRLRFHMSGPLVYLGKQSVNGLALVFHELTTNAIKYGSLASECGEVDVRWAEADDETIAISWIERGGKEISTTPAAQGFGSKLLQDTITYQFGGSLALTWSPLGLEARILIDKAKLTI